MGRGTRGTGAQAISGAALRSLLVGDPDANDDQTPSWLPPSDEVVLSDLRDGNLSYIARVDDMVLRRDPDVHVHLPVLLRTLDEHMQYHRGEEDVSDRVLSLAGLLIISGDDELLNAGNRLAESLTRRAVEEWASESPASGQRLLGEILRRSGKSYSAAAHTRDRGELDTLHAELSDNVKALLKDQNSDLSDEGYGLLQRLARSSVRATTGRALKRHLGNGTAMVRFWTGGASGTNKPEVIDLMSGLKYAEDGTGDPFKLFQEGITARMTSRFS